MAGTGDGKYKGVGRYGHRRGMGRLRRANSHDGARQGGWEQRADDDAFLEQHGHVQRRSHGGEALLAKFNRLAHTYDEDQNGLPGTVSGFAGLTVLVRDSDGTEHACVVRQNLKKRIAGVKNPLCIGDHVRFIIADSDPVITAVCARTNQLARTDSHNRALLHVFAANIDRLIITAALAEPDLKFGLIDRYLLIAAYNDIKPIIVFTKTDLADAQAALSLYTNLGYESHAVCAIKGTGIDALRTALTKKVCVFAGQSGVGKSSLINALFPELAARVGVVADAGHGRHTTTSARSYVVAGGGELIDTPGIRECGISGMTPLDVALFYPDLAAYHAQCHFDDCTHLHEPGCAVQQAVAEGNIANSRYESYRSIIKEDLADDLT